MEHPAIPWKRRTIVTGQITSINIECGICLDLTCLKRVASVAPRLKWESCMRRRVTGRFWTSCLHTSHVLFPLMVNHLIVHSLCARANSPLHIHSILKASESSPNSTKQILHTASSSGTSSPPSTFVSETFHYYKAPGWLQIEQKYLKLSCLLALKAVYAANRWEIIFQNIWFIEQQFGLNNFKSVQIGLNWFKSN